MREELKKETRRHLARFLVIGGASVACDGLFYLLFAGGMGFDTHLSKGVSYALGMLLGFVGNKLWTFESARRSMDEPLSYVILYTVTLGVNIGINAAALEIGGLGVLAEPWVPAWAFLAATGTTTVLNFLGLRFITFRRGIEQARGKKA